MLLDGFRAIRIATPGGEIVGRVGGDGPPLLLLHGFPQTHVMWHRIAPALARRFTVVATDLRGYGGSARPAGAADHGNYAKRAVAADQVEVMEQLGFSRFAVVGHDRGARVGHRLATDWPERVTRLAVLDIVPTLAIFEATDQALATGYFHWFFMIQPRGLPEHLIGCDPDYYLRYTLGSWGGSLELFDPEAVAAYLAPFREPATIHGMCEDYRAAATIDLEHDRADIAAGRMVTCPLLALWGRHGLMDKHFDVLAEWRKRATDVRGQALEAGHFMAEERPQETLAALEPFLAG